MRIGESIEKRLGVDEPDYEVTERPAVEIHASPTSSTINGAEVIIALAFPVAGFGLAIWRFGRGDVGPGIADLLLCAIGAVIACILVASGAIW